MIPVQIPVPGGRMSFPTPGPSECGEDPLSAAGSLSLSSEEAFVGASSDGPGDRAAAHSLGFHSYEEIKGLSMTRGV